MTDRAKFRAVGFPRPSLFGALFRPPQFKRGRECREDLEKLLFVYVPQRAPDRLIYLRSLWTQGHEIITGAAATITPRHDHVAGYGHVEAVLVLLSVHGVGAIVRLPTWRRPTIRALRLIERGRPDAREA